MLNLLATFYVEKKRFFLIFFSNSEFGMRVYRGKTEAKLKNILLCTFLRISPRKINILKKNKLGSRELNKFDGMNVKKNVTQFSEYFEIYYENVRKMEKK